MDEINIIDKNYITHESEPFYIHKIDRKVKIGDVVSPRSNTEMLCEVVSNTDEIIHVKFLPKEGFLDIEHLSEEWVKIGTIYKEGMNTYGGTVRIN